MQLNVALNTHSPLLLQLIFSKHSNNNLLWKEEQQSKRFVQLVKSQQRKHNSTAQFSCISYTLTLAIQLISADTVSVNQQTNHTQIKKQSNKDNHSSLQLGTVERVFLPFRGNQSIKRLPRQKVSSQINHLWKWKCWVKSSIQPRKCRVKSKLSQTKQNIVFLIKPN